MKSLVIFISVVLAQGISSVADGAAFESNLVAQVHIEGSNSLVIFRGLITPLNYQLMGFSSTNEIATATSGEPLPIYTMGLSQLTNYSPGSDLSLLLEPAPNEPAPRVIVPIMAGTNVRSSTILRQVGAVGGQGTHWTNMNWGKPALIRDLMGTYRAIPDAALRHDTIRFVVEVPVFDIWFIAYYDRQNKLVFRSTADLRLGPVTVARNQIVPEAAMHQLRITAQRYNGLPN